MSLTHRENMVLALEHKLPEWVPHLASESYRMGDYIVERPMTVEGRDAWGVMWHPCEASLNLTHPDTSTYLLDYEEITDWKKLLKFPDQDAIDWTPVIEQVKTFTDREQYLTHFISLNGIFERMHILMGFEGALIACMEEPEAMRDLAEAIVDHKIRTFRKIWDIAQPEILLYHDDWGTQQAPFLPHETFVEILKEPTRRLAAAAHEIGYRWILHHSCGKVESLIPDMIEIGMDGWDSAQPCNDLARIKREYGDRLVIATGMDAQGVIGNPNSTPEQLRHEVESKIDMLGENGGLICDTVPAYSLNPKNEEIVLEEIRRYGKIYCDRQRALHGT